MERANAQATTAASMTMRSGLEELVTAPRFRYQVECIGQDGALKWTEDVHNVVCTEGKDYLIDTFFKIGTAPTAWYMGLAGAGTKAAANTLASHAAWAEVNPYTGNRPAITFGTTSSGSNTATAVSYSCTGSATVAGAFVANVNTGTTGKLYSVSDFTGSRAVVNGDTLNVTLTVAF